MMIESRDGLTFLLNSLWQVTLAWLVAVCVCRLLRKGPASHRHAVWVAAMVAAVLLPLTSLRGPAQVQGPQFAPPLPEPAAVGTAAPVRVAFAPAEPARSVSVAATTASVLLGAYFCFVLLRMALLGWASIRTVQIRRKAIAPRIPENLERVWQRCQEAFGLDEVELLISERVSGPVTAGRAIILPESFLREPSEDVLTTAIGHEMAHILRRDFPCNLAYELMFAPIAFHPGAWQIRHEIERTREMACDELVTGRLMEAGVYARSILRMAGDMMALPRPWYTLGVFDGDILEERIRRLLEKPVENLRRARLVLAGGLTALGVCVVLASGLAITARAQGAASELLKQGAEAFNRGDIKDAIRYFESAATVEPGNAKAKLLLAHALLKSAQPGMGGDAGAAARARKLYLDTLAVDKGNKQALAGLIMLSSVGRQLDETRGWALQAVQADPKDTAGYYTLGFLDWSMTYPDYMAARAAAGMRPEDPGTIPDPALRQKVRAQHGGHLEEGFRALQIALQIDPACSDAMAYLNLLYRIESALAETPEQSAAALKKADEWVQAALAAKRRAGLAAHRSETALDADGAAPGPPMMMAPPPPPPPPPPSGQSGRAIRTVPPDAIRISGEELQGRIVRQVPPIYPSSGGEGEVVLNVVVNKDGTVRGLTAMTAPSADLAKAAMQAVWQWEFRPTLLNGSPVEVASTVSVRFAGR
ncbi:MAG: M56 family metallopeptidase [Candidatus Solibacter sp.]